MPKALTLCYIWMWIGMQGVAVLPAVAAQAGATSPPRRMERLGRGVVAVPVDQNSAFVSWRLLGTEPADLAFNVYRVSAGGEPVLLNEKPLTGGTNLIDDGVDLTEETTYRVVPMADGRETGEAGSFRLPANATAEPCLRIPLQPLPDHYVHLAWVGDLDGDGEYDLVVDRLPTVEGPAQKLEAYRRDGTFLWRVDFGPNSTDRERTSNASGLISQGMNDNVTVYDLDMDGRAEVIVKSANGVTFGDGTILNHPNDLDQFISVLDGMTGAELARGELPNHHKEYGPVTGHAGIIYADGVHPSFLLAAKNRVGKQRKWYKAVTVWDYRDGKLKQRWSWERGERDDLATYHQIRILDVDGDGKDEFCDGGYVLDDDGTLLYKLKGIVHGDRFHIGDLDPDRPGLEGYGVQQDNPSKLGEYYYDAATGDILREHFLPEVADIGRGIAADIDPDHRGYEYWSFSGVFNAQSGSLVSPEPERPRPNFRIWWDGDTLSENLNRTMVEKWNPRNPRNPATRSCERLLTGYKFGATHTWRDAPVFYGDILGDWREEIICEHQDHSSLLIFTSPIPTDVRLYTLAHNPAYRLCFTVKGYMQSNMIDYYLGHGMTAPPWPNIVTPPFN